MALERVYDSGTILGSSQGMVDGLNFKGSFSPEGRKGLISKNADWMVERFPGKYAVRSSNPLVWS